MFCKWCGATLPNTTGNCPRCGKETPALSDCGGFYDLVPGARRRSAGVSDSTPVTPKVDSVNVAPKKYDPQKKDMQAKSEKNGRQNNGLQLLTACIGFVVVIVLLLSMNSKISKILDSTTQNDGKIDMIYEELLQVKESTQGNKNEGIALPDEGETDPNNILLEAQDTRIEIIVNHTKEGASVKTTSDLGNFEDAVVAQVMLDRVTQSLSEVQIDLSEIESSIKIKVNSELAASSSGMGRISVDFEVDELIFAEIQNNAEYEWEYRIYGSVDWMPLDKNIFTIENGATVTYIANDLADLLKDAEMAEFKLTYKRNNVEGGSLTILISGITVTSQSLENQAITN